MHPEIGTIFFLRNKKKQLKLAVVTNIDETRMSYRYVLGGGSGWSTSLNNVYNSHDYIVATEPQIRKYIVETLVNPYNKDLEFLNSIL